MTTDLRRLDQISIMEATGPASRDVADQITARGLKRAEQMQSQA
jgi:hypothetical protein